MELGPVARRELQPHGRGIESGQITPCNTQGIHNGGALDVAEAGDRAQARVCGNMAGLGVIQGVPLRIEGVVGGLKK